MMQSLIFAGGWIPKQRGVSWLCSPQRLALIVAAAAMLLLLATASFAYVDSTSLVDSLKGEPKPGAIILLGIGFNGLAGVALRMNRK